MAPGTRSLHRGTAAEVLGGAGPRAQDRRAEEPQEDETAKIYETRTCCMRQEPGLPKNGGGSETAHGGRGSRSEERDSSCTGAGAGRAASCTNSRESATGELFSAGQDAKGLAMKMRETSPMEPGKRLSAQQPVPQEQTGKRQGAGTAAVSDDNKKEMAVMPRMRAWVETIQVMALLDAGASRSLISRQIASRLQGEVTQLEGRMTSRPIGTGYTCDSKGMVTGIRVCIVPTSLNMIRMLWKRVFDVVMGLDSSGHAKPMWDFVTDEVHFWCPTDPSVQPDRRSDTSNACNAACQHALGHTTARQIHSRRCPHWRLWLGIGPYT